MIERHEKYWDAETESYRTIKFLIKRSMAGRGFGGPEYKVSYLLSSGRWLNGIRHTDRGDLMTDVHETAKPWVLAPTEKEPRIKRPRRRRKALRYDGG